MLINRFSFRFWLTFEPWNICSLSEGGLGSEWQDGGHCEVRPDSIQMVELLDSPEKDMRFYERLLAGCFHFFIYFKQTSHTVLCRTTINTGAALLDGAPDLALLISTLQLCYTSIICPPAGNSFFNSKCLWLPQPISFLSILGKSRLQERSARSKQWLLKAAPIET